SDPGGRGVLCLRRDADAGPARIEGQGERSPGRRRRGAEGRRRRLRDRRRRSDRRRRAPARRRNGAHPHGSSDRDELSHHGARQPRADDGRRRRDDRDQLSGLPTGDGAARRAVRLAQPANALPFATTLPAFRQIANKRRQAAPRALASPRNLTGGPNHALHPGPMVEHDRALIVEAIARVVRLSTAHAWAVIPAFLIAAALAGLYVSRHIAINTDSSKLLSSSLPWRQQEMKLNRLFPQRTDLMIAVIDATTPEAADDAADALVGALSGRTDVVRTVSRPDGGEFFARNGVLFLSLDDLKSNMAQLIKAQPFLGTLAADPTLRGILGAVSQSLEGVRHEKTTLEDLEPAFSSIADAIEGVEQGRHPAFSWRRL